jgi:hypothetical protein
LNCNTKRKGLQAKHINHKLQMHGYLFLSLVFMKVSVEKQHSFSIELITCTIVSQLDVLQDFDIMNMKRSKVSPQHGQ